MTMMATPANLEILTATGLFVAAYEGAGPNELCVAVEADNDDARRVIQQTIAFWKTHLEPVPQPATACQRLRPATESRTAVERALAVAAGQLVGNGVNGPGPVEQRAATGEGDDLDHGAAQYIV